MGLSRVFSRELGAALMAPASPIVFVVDDDISVRESLELLIQNEGWQPKTFASAQEFLDCPRAVVPSCLVLDVSLPGLNGLELQKRVAVERTEMQELRDRYGSLTPRERQVMALVVSGLLNKQVGGELGISEVTVKAHRGQVMQKMKANSVADLVKMAGRLRVTERSAKQTA
jgi:FixJ family two-component response regulator